MPYPCGVFMISSHPCHPGHLGGPGKLIAGELSVPNPERVGRSSPATTLHAMLHKVFLGRTFTGHSPIFSKREAATLLRFKNFRMGLLGAPHLFGTGKQIATTLAGPFATVCWRILKTDGWPIASIVRAIAGATHACTTDVCPSGSSLRVAPLQAIVETIASMRRLKSRR
jgi:hypothetical protein